MHDSDTESEPETSLPLCTATEFTDASRTLKSQDVSFYNMIQKAHDDILQFLDRVLAASGTAENVENDIVALAHVFHSSFLTLLFQYRQIFHRIASRAVPFGAAVPINICWVDTLLVKLGEVAVFVASGYVTVDPGPLPQSLQTQRGEDSLRAAAQLPHTWEYVENVISSEYASPAAIRLALTLTFACHVMAPQLKARPDVDTIVPAMVKVWSAYIQRLAGNHPKDNASFQLQESTRIGYSMIICIFTKTSSRINQTTNAEPPFQPLMLSNLLHLIQSVMQFDEKCTLDGLLPIEHLDSAQNILVRWGETIPFCWSAWRDQRIAHAESITHLTATWLYHLEIHDPKSCSDSDPPSWPGYLTACLAKDSDASTTAIIQQLQNGVLALRTKRGGLQPLINVLCRSCWATTQLVQIAPTDTPRNTVEAQMCEYLCNIFVLLDDTSEDVRAKDGIIECLTFIAPENVLSALNQLQKNVKTHFVVKLENMIIREKRKILVAKHNELTTDDLIFTKALLQFLTIIWHSRSEGGVHHHTLSCFLVPLVDWLTQEDQDLTPNVFLLESLLTALAALERLRSEPTADNVTKFRLWDDESIWRLVVGFSSSNLVIASCFANLIIATPEDRLCDPISCVEAWGYLRDVALLILSHHFLGDDEPLALIIFPVISQALLLLLQRGGSRVSMFIISSPWTINLCTELQNHIDNDHLTNYSRNLAERNAGCGNFLLKEITSKLRSNEDDDLASQLSVAFKPRLMFFRLGINSRLLLVPCDAS